LKLILIIPWRRHCLHFDVVIRKEKFVCHHADKADKVADAVVVALIFNRVVMEKMISHCPLTVAGEEENEINPRHQETWH
jgi:hypothetical protein